tara:strand:- start:170 stop:1078 length:909 start_codon:yes stop_codon:yes gene_type:complete
MKILITGATGSIGKTIVKVLLSKGYRINFLTTSRSKVNFFKGAKGFYWKPNRKEIDSSCFVGIDSIIHLAGYSVLNFWTKSVKKKIMESRLQSTSLLYNEIHKLGDKIQLKSFISASAIGIYESSFKKVHYEKDNLKRKNFLQNVVYEWEREVLKFSKLNFKVTILRIGLVMSKNARFLKAFRLTLNFGIGLVFGKGNQFQPWIHIEDLSSIFLFALNNQLEGVYNAVSPNPVTQSNFIRIFSNSINQKCLILNIPSFIIKIFLGEMSCLILNSHNVSSSKIQSQGYKFHYPNLMSALKSFF